MVSWASFVGFGNEGGGPSSWVRISVANRPGGKGSAVVMERLKSESESGSGSSLGGIEGGMLASSSAAEKLRIEVEVRSKFQSGRIGDSEGDGVTVSVALEVRCRVWGVRRLETIAQGVASGMDGFR